MLVEINLLPQKEHRKKGILFIVLAMLALFLLLGGLYFWQIQSVKSEIAIIDKQIETTQKIAEAEGNNESTDTSSMSVGLLKNAVEWAKTYPIQTIPVMQHLTSLLPERGFIQSFGYTETGTVTLTVQFDSSREAAYFLNSLLESEWIEEASLSSLNAEDEESKETSTESTNQTTTSESGSDENANSTTGNNNSVIITTDPNNPNSFIITPVNPNVDNVDNESDTSKLNSKKELSVILPRYIGQFEISLNKETIKRLISKSGTDEEGVPES